jgi:hypothetical protein
MCKEEQEIQILLRQLYNFVPPYMWLPMLLLAGIEPYMLSADGFYLTINKNYKPPMKVMISHTIRIIEQHEDPEQLLLFIRNFIDLEKRS